MEREAGGPGLEPGSHGSKGRHLALDHPPVPVENCPGPLDTTMPRVAGPTVVILAAGEGTRMRSSLPKVLHPLCGRPLIAWPLEAAREAGAGKLVVVDGPGRALDGRLPADVILAVQEEPKGTGDAVAAAAQEIG